MPAGKHGGAAAPIPDKLYFKIGEVALLVGVQAHVLRYWEREISLIRPGKSASRQRRYRRRDVEVFREIKRLLYEERYTLAGAKKRILGGGDDGGSAGDVLIESGDEMAAQRGQGRAEPQVDEGAVVPSRSLGARDDVRRTFGRDVVDNLKSELEALVRLAGEEP